MLLTLLIPGPYPRYGFRAQGLASLTHMGNVANSGQVACMWKVVAGRMKGSWCSSDVYMASC